MMPTNEPARPREPRSLPRRLLAAYSAPAFSQSFLVGPAISVLQGIYAKHFGLTLDEIALVIFVSRLFNAVSDPIIGMLSDASRARLGSRKPWLIAGSIVAVVACWFLYVPPGRVTVLSFLGWFLLADIGWSMTEVPYSAWMAELTEDYAERTRIATWRSVGRYLGMIAFFGLPLAAAPILGTTEFTPVTLRWSAILAIFVMPATAIAATWLVPNGTAPTIRHSLTFGDTLRSVFRNRPLRWFAVMYACSGLANGMGWGLMFFYVDGYLGLGSHLSALLVVSIPIAVVAAPAWGAVSRRFGKQQIWAFGCAAAAVLSLGYITISPGPLAGAALAATLLLLNVAVVAEGVAAPAVLADVVDYGRLKFGGDYAGTYFALFAMLTKGNIGIGAAISLAAAKLLGFDAAAPALSSGVFGLFVAFAAMPAASYALAAILIWRFPIDAARQRTIVRALARRQTRRAAPASALGVAR